MSEFYCPPIFENTISNKTVNVLKKQLKFQGPVKVLNGAVYILEILNYGIRQIKKKQFLKDSESNRVLSTATKVNYYLKQFVI